MEVGVGLWRPKGTEGCGPDAQGRKGGGGGGGLLGQKGKMRLEEARGQAAG